MKWYLHDDPLAKFAVKLPESVVTQLHKFKYYDLVDHVHEIVIFLVLYSTIYVLSGIVTPHVLPAYSKLSKRNQVNFDMHVVSHVQAIILCFFAFAMFFDPSLDSLTSSTPFSSMAVASANGYFIWDLYVSVKYIDMFGMPFVAHALAALFTFFEATRPFLHNYAAPFMLYEMSTPFVNIHWFATHVPGMIPSKLHKINGLFLITAFFIFRICLGSFFGYKLFTEAFASPPIGVPKWSLYAVLTTYTTLTLLNFSWFSKMIKIATKTLKETKKKVA